MIREQRIARGDMTSCVRTGFVLILVFSSTSPALGEVVGFDDLPTGVFLTGSDYSGLVWEEGNGGSNGLAGQWYVPEAGNHPHSPPCNVDNAQGATLMGIGFRGTADIQGAYFSVQGAPSTVWATAIRVHGYLAGQPTTTTSWLTPLTTTPQWLDMTGLVNVDRIVVEAAPAEFSQLGGFGMDDLTFSYVPEPAGMSLGLLALGGLLLRRRRGGKSPKDK